MRKSTLWLSFTLRSLGLGSETSGSGTNRLEPSCDSARANAHHIFNAVHSAGRQWGSSLNHNGFSFFPAVVPRGTVLYHGSRFDYPPSTFEWLAFEREHSELFAASFPLDQRPRHPKGDPRPDHDDSQVPLSAGVQFKNPVNVSRGYLHTYRANRDLNLLYIDGISAGKTRMGTLDSQDLVLLGNRTEKSFDEAHHPSAWRNHVAEDPDRPELGSGLNELTRARGLCDLVMAHGFDGIVRTEIGFEVIYCDFSDGLDLASVTRSFLDRDKMRRGGTMTYHWARAAGQRYDGVLDDRFRLDFSSMMSGFFFPINISSTEASRPDLIRLGAESLDHLQDIKAHVERVCSQPRKFTVNWQAAVDIIVTRFSDGLALMDWDEVSAHDFVFELEHLVLSYYDAPLLAQPDGVEHEVQAVQNATQQAVERCVNNYLLSALSKEESWSLEDRLVHAAVRAVLERICDDLFAMRAMLLEASPEQSTQGYYIQSDPENDEFQEALRASRAMTRSLTEWLAWTVWKKTRACQPDEMMFVAMWPLGVDEDHWQPGCRSIKYMEVPRGSYWNVGWSGNA